MTPRERALKVAMQWQDCTDPTNMRVLALMGLVQLAIEAANDEAVKRVLCSAIDRIGGDAHSGMRFTAKELADELYATHCSLSERERQCEKELHKHFVQHVLDVVPYVRSTISSNNRFPAQRKEWCEVHAERADSSVVQLDNIEREAMRLKSGT